MPLDLSQETSKALFLKFLSRQGEPETSTDEFPHIITATDVVHAFGREVTPKIATASGLFVSVNTGGAVVGAIAFLAPPLLAIPHIHFVGVILLGVFGAAVTTSIQEGCLIGLDLYFGEEWKGGIQRVRISSPICGGINTSDLVRTGIFYQVTGKDLDIALFPLHIQYVVRVAGKIITSLLKTALGHLIVNIDEVLQIDNKIIDPIMENLGKMLENRTETLEANIDAMITKLSHLVDTTTDKIEENTQLNLDNSWLGEKEKELRENFEFDSKELKEKLQDHVDELHKKALNSVSDRTWERCKNVRDKVARLLLNPLPDLFFVTRPRYFESAENLQGGCSFTQMISDIVSLRIPFCSPVIQPSQSSQRTQSAHLTRSVQPTQPIHMFALRSRAIERKQQQQPMKTKKRKLSGIDNSDRASKPCVSMVSRGPAVSYSKETTASKVLPTKSKLWKTIVSHAGWDECNMSFPTPFFMLLSAIVGFNVTEKIMDADGNIGFSKKNERNESYLIFPLDNKWTLRVMSWKSVCSFGLMKNGRNSIDIPTFGEALNLFSNMVHINELQDLLPKSMSDLSTGLTMNDLACYLGNGFPYVYGKIVYTLNEESALKKDLGIQSFTMELQFSFVNNIVNLFASVLMSLGSVDVRALIPKSSIDPWVLTLDNPEGITLSSLLDSIPGINIDETGLWEVADRSAAIKGLRLAFGKDGIEFFELAVETKLAMDFGEEVAIKDPFVWLQLEHPFIGAQRSIALGLGFSVSIGGKSVHCSGNLQYVAKKVSGSIDARYYGKISLNDFMDTSSIKPLKISELNIDIDVGEMISLDHPFLQISFGEMRILKLGWNDMYIQIGGPEKLLLDVKIPVATLTDNVLREVEVKYNKRDQKTEFTTLIETQTIGKGLELFGDTVEKLLTEKEDILMTIEDYHNHVHLLFPHIFPSELKLSKGMILQNLNAYVMPGNPLVLGVEADLDLNMLGHIVDFHGSLSLGNNITGTLSLRDDNGISIGEHIKVDQFTIQFQPDSAGGEADFLLYNKKGQLELLMDIEPPMPTLFNVTYPSQLGLIQFIEAFVGKIPIDESLDIIVFQGLTDKNGKLGDLILAFNIQSPSFTIKCRCIIMNGIFDGFIDGNFSIQDGLVFKVQVKSLDWGLLKLTGYVENTNPTFMIDIPGMHSNRPNSPRLFLSCMLNIEFLKIKSSLEVDVSKQGLLIKADENLWEVLMASIVIQGLHEALYIDARFHSSICEILKQKVNAAVDSVVDEVGGKLKDAVAALDAAKKRVNSLETKIDEMKKDVTAEKKALEDKLQSVQNVLDNAKKAVESKKNDIKQMEAKVKAERERAIQSLEEKKEHLQECEDSVDKLKYKIEKRKCEIELMKENGVKKMEATKSYLKSCKRVVYGIKRNISSQEDRISWYQHRIDGLKDDLDDLSFWSCWKAPGILAHIAELGVCIGGIEAVKGGLYVTMKTAKAAVDIAEDGVSAAENVYKVLPDEEMDPQLDFLEGEKKVADLALDAAKQILTGVEGVVKWVPLDLDPRVAALIAAEKLEEGAVDVAKLPVSVAQAAVEHCPDWAMDPRIIALEGTKDLANAALTLVEKTVSGMDTIVEGPIREALHFVANKISDALGIDITDIHFHSLLSMLHESEVELDVSFTFYGSSKELTMKFTFGSPITLIERFAEQLADDILHIGGDNGGNKKFHEDQKANSGKLKQEARNDIETFKSSVTEDSIQLMLTKSMAHNMSLVVLDEEKQAKTKMFKNINDGIDNSSPPALLDFKSTLQANHDNIDEHINETTSFKEQLDKLLNQITKEEKEIAEKNKKIKEDYDKTQEKICQQIKSSKAVGNEGDVKNLKQQLQLNKENFEKLQHSETENKQNRIKQHTKNFKAMIEQNEKNMEKIADLNTSNTKVIEAVNKLHERLIEVAQQIQTAKRERDSLRMQITTNPDKADTLQQQLDEKIQEVKELRLQFDDIERSIPTIKHEKVEQEHRMICLKHASDLSNQISETYKNMLALV